MKSNTTGLTLKVHVQYLGDAMGISKLSLSDQIRQDQKMQYHMNIPPGRLAQSVTCLVTDAKLTADPGVASSIPARSHTFVEIDHEIISTVSLLPSAESFMKGCCQLQAKVCVTACSSLPRKKVWLGELTVPQ